jgi:PST family polysaccharide transporter
VSAQGARLIVAFGSTIVLARLVTPSDFGLVAMVLSVTGFLGIFRELGLATATVQTPVISVREISTLFWINAAAGLVLMLVTMALSPAIAWFYGDARLAAIGFALAPAVLFSGAACQHRAILRRQMRFSAVASIDVVSLAVGSSAAVAAAWAGLGYWALVLLPLVTESTSAISAWLLCTWRPAARAPLRDVRRHLVFGGNIAGFEVVNYWARNVDNVLIGRLWGAYSLGLYTRAYQVLLLPMEVLSGPIGVVAISALSRVAADSPQHYRAAALGIVQKLSIVTMPAAVIMIAVPDWIVAVLLGSQWSAAAPFVAVLGIAAFTQPISQTAGWLLITQGRTRDLLTWGFIGSGIAVVSIVIGVHWGPLGVAVAYVGGGLFVRTPLLFWFLGRSGPIRSSDYASALLIPAAAAGAAVLGAIAFRSIVGPVNPILGLLGVVISIFAAGMAVLVMLPGGRRLIRDIATLSRLALSRERVA